MAHGGWYISYRIDRKMERNLIQILKSTTELKQLHSHSCSSASFFVKTDKRTEKNT